ncbi:hypothetical protein [Phocoenobacter skyensis]|uniref:Uncharacterized protein n=1 Tax=Phocoenobacter skyensis TaxID=97481 RepID=A0A1H7XLH1_9PAST|nr:hypothetical protein [Pasteurella skyensis]MDP8184364.1 hypothetical protein [Pasteurella skyensis]QLB22628.1 hypothetical protein A6B44_05170 [Pasteurella skyensis]SEM34601.1 hypothetical protein SAMN05444853_11329 [Pasteurella skyensis]
MSLFDQVEQEIEKVTNEVFQQIEKAKLLIKSIDPEDDDFKHKIEKALGYLGDAQATLGDLE